MNLHEEGIPHGGSHGGGRYWLAVGSLKKEDMERGRGHFLQKQGLPIPVSLDSLPSVSSARQETDLVYWGQFAHTTLHGGEVDVLRGHVGSQSEVL